MRQIKILLTLVMVAFLTLFLAVPVSFADGDEIVEGSGGRVTPVPAGTSPFPSEPGLTPPFTNHGQGNYTDANGYDVDLTGPDGNEEFKFRNADDREAANDPEWQKHKGKFPGTYREWKDLQQYADPTSDLWGVGGHDYQIEAGGGVDATGIHGDFGEASVEMDQGMRMESD